MFKIEQVFVPVDFSRASKAALGLATNLPGARVQLAHVIEPWPPYIQRVLFPYAGMGEDTAEFERELVESAFAELRSFYDLENTLGQHDPKPLVTAGVVKEKLPEMLSATPSDIVVMGSHGRSGALPESLGSTCGRLLRTSAQPVLFVREHASTPKIEKILCAIDLSSRCHEIVAAAMSLALDLDAELETVFVLPDPLHQDVHNMLQGHIKFNGKKVLDKERHKLDALFERAYNQLDLTYPDKNRIVQRWRQRKVLVGNPADEIISRADTRDADLIVVGNRNLQATKSASLGRTAWAVARAATTNVLVVPLSPEAHILNSND